MNKRKQKIEENKIRRDLNKRRDDADCYLMSFGINESFKDSEGLPLTREEFIEQAVSAADWTYSFSLDYAIRKPIMLEVKPFLLNAYWKFADTIEKKLIKELKKKKKVKK